MEWQQLIMDIFLRVSQELEAVLDGLTVDEINQQPRPDCNSIGWLAWHLTRSHDRNMSEIAGKEQLWTSDGWHAKFNLPPNPAETGVGYSSKEAAAFKAPDGNTLLEYHHAVLERIKDYVSNTLSETELKRESESPTLGIIAPVRRRLVGVISEGLQHVGQAAYVRGLLKGKGWLGR